MRSMKGSVALEGVKTAEEAMDKAGLAWSIEQTELVGVNGINVPDHKMLYRGDNQYVLGIVGKGYEPVQNSTALSFFDVVTAKYGASYEYGGMTKGGRKVFLQAKLPNSFEARKGDRVDCYLTLCNGNDGTYGLKAFLTPIRLFCSNQLVNAVKKASCEITLRHTASIHDRIELALAIFNTSLEAFEEFKQKSIFLAQKIMDKQMVEKFLNELMPKESTRSDNQKEEILHLFHNGAGNNGTSAWDAANAVAEYVCFYRGKDADKRAESALFGQGSQLTGKAFDLATSI